MTVIKKNIFFVKLNDKFNELTNQDQKLILQKNMSEMCHIRGAIRFDTKSKNFVWYFSKKDQLQMAFEKKKPEAGSSSSSSSSSSASSSSAKNARLSNALIGQQDMSKFYKSTTRLELKISATKYWKWSQTFGISSSPQSFRHWPQFAKFTKNYWSKN